MLKYTLPVATLFSLFLVESSALADINSSGYQISAYAGVAGTPTDPGNLEWSGETDSLKNGNQQSDFTWGFGAAYRYVMPAATTAKPNILHDIALGLDLFYFKTTQTGDVWVYQSSSMNNYTYQLPINSLRLMLDSEWSFHTMSPRVFPFVVGGIGVAQNKASYNDTPDEGIGGSGRTVNANTTYQFAYSLGAGVKVLLTDSVDMSLRYLYSNLGNATTSQTGSATLVAPLTTQLNTQALLLGISYIF